jgi:filamentous hemagglutinin family protein
MVLIFSVLSIPLPIAAQVVPDKTLSNNSEVKTEGNTNIIEGGTSSGNNLFHSFDSFSVSTGGTAYFNNAREVQNIFSRVTGSSISNIDGLIKANGSANLFLLNPNGILFGPNASLNLGGSFFATTANSIKFSDGVEFSATNPQVNPALTVSVPVGLGFASNPGDITVRGQGNNLTVNPQTAQIIRDNRPVGIQVNPAQTLALLGGNINLEGANLTAEGGRIELGSVGGGGIVNLSPTELGFRFDYGNVRDFQNVNLLQAASLDASGDGGGDIRVRGDRVLLGDSSSILAETTGSSDGGNITVKATEALEIVGVNLGDSKSVPSGLFASAEPGATGNGGNIEVNTNNLRLADGGQIASRTFGAGDAGTINITAGEIELVGVSPFNRDSPSRIVANTESGATGNGGNIQVNADRLKLADGARIANRTFGEGNAGTIDITAEEIELVGVNQIDPIFSSSSLTASAEKGATGNGGNIQVSAERLKLSDGSVIANGTVGEGDAGTIDITAGEIELVGVNQFIPQNASRIAANTESTGNGGDIEVKTDRLRIADGARISSGTSGEENAGTIDITAGEIELVGVNQFIPQNASRISANTESTGNGGNIQVNAESLRIADGARISSEAGGEGNAGNIIISADRIQSDRGRITATSDKSGGGEINLNTGQLFLRDNSLISTSVFDRTGAGGTLTIDTDTLVALNNSDITARADEGVGGKIAVSARGVLRSLDSDVDASSEFGIDGEVNINSATTDFQNSLNPISPKFIVTEQAIAGSCLARRNQQQGSFVYAGTGGLPENPSSATDEEESLSVRLLEKKITSPASGKLEADSEEVSSSAETIIYPAQTARKWQIGDPIIEPTNLIRTADGRLFWVRKGVDNVSSQICQ